jgi:hypothetical protein
VQHAFGDLYRGRYPRDRDDFVREISGNGLMRPFFRRGLATQILDGLLADDDTLDMAVDEIALGKWKPPPS